MSKIYENLTVDQLISESLKRGEGEIASNGALLVKTGKRTGRSPLDRFIVDDEKTKESVDWGEVNRPFDRDAFDKLWSKVEDYLSSKVNFCLLLTRR